MDWPNTLSIFAMKALGGPSNPQMYDAIRATQVI
jgi:hypothetical protein